MLARQRIKVGGWPGPDAGSVHAYVTHDNAISTSLTEAATTRLLRGSRASGARGKKNRHEGYRMLASARFERNAARQGRAAGGAEAAELGSRASGGGAQDRRDRGAAALGPANHGCKQKHRAPVTYLSPLNPSFPAGPISLPTLLNRLITGGEKKAASAS